MIHDLRPDLKNTLDKFSRLLGHSIHNNSNNSGEVKMSPYKPKTSLIR